VNCGRSADFLLGFDSTGGSIMQTHAHLTAPGTPTGDRLGLHAGRESLGAQLTARWQSRTRKHVADLLDDADALADWHRNLERLRRGEHG